MKLQHVYETAKDSQHRITECGGTPAGRGRMLSCIIRIDPESRFQTFRGFGCAVTESAGYVLSFLPEDMRRRIVGDCFSAGGNAYAFARTHLNSCDFSLENWACVPERDETLASFSFERSDRYLTPVLRLAAEQNGKLSVLVSPWSPPAWMKTNGDMNNGGRLKAEYRRLWADYFVRFLQGLRDRGLHPGYVTIQNECEAAQTWDSCLWTGQEEAEFAVQFLRPALAAGGLSDVKVLAWDHNRDRLLARMQESFSVDGAWDAIDGMAYHWYSGGQYDQVAACSAALRGKELFFTEGCVEGGPRPGRWFSGERYGHNIINDLNSGCTAWIDWNMALDSHGGPNHAGNFCDAPILVDTDAKTVSYQSSFYYIGQFSRFITPGSRRIACSMTPFMVPAACDGQMGDLMESTAFLTPGGEAVLVVMNRTEEDMVFALEQAQPGVQDMAREKRYTMAVSDENRGACYVCPPRAIQTYILGRDAG